MKIEKKDVFRVNYFLWGKRTVACICVGANTRPKLRRVWAGKLGAGCQYALELIKTYLKWVNTIRCVSYCDHLYRGIFKWYFRLCLQSTKIENWVPLLGSHSVRQGGAIWSDKFFSESRRLYDSTDIHFSSFWYLEVFLFSPFLGCPFSPRI